MSGGGKKKSLHYGMPDYIYSDYYVFDSYSRIHVPTILTIILPWSVDSEAAEADTPAPLSDASVREVFRPGTFKKELT